MIYTILEGLESVQGSQEWRAFRKGKIGASDCASIMGMNPWETPYECWRRFVYNEQKEMNSAMQRGHELEPIARAMFNEKIGFSKPHFNPIVAHLIKQPNIMASLDGWNGEEILEIKCPTKIPRDLHSVPRNYRCQMQHQMMVMNARRVWYCVFDGKEIHITEMVRNNTEIDTIIKAELHFLKSIANLTPPDFGDPDWYLKERVV